MAIERRSDGKLEITTRVNQIVDVLNGMGRYDPIIAGHRPANGNETWIATVTGAIAGSQGYYTGVLMQGGAAPRSSSPTIQNSDFGTQDQNTSVVIANLNEIAGSTSLSVSGSAVVFGRFIGTNSIANGGVGTSAVDGLPIMVVSGPSIGQIFEVTLSSPSGSSTAGYSYTATDLNGTALGTGLTPFRAWPLANINIATAATTGCGYYNTSGTFVLKYADEILTTEPC
jgi:hypothetical protein